MAIISTNLKNEVVGTKYVGRVLEVVHFTATRNWSDTLDYTDFRSTACVKALVWLGTFGPPWTRIGCAEGTSYCLSFSNDARVLEPHEQFVWIDCTNLFADRNDRLDIATKDANFGEGEPLMWVNYIAYQSFLKAEEIRLVALAAEQIKRDAQAAAKIAASAAKRAANDDAKRAMAEAALASIPKKGASVKVPGKNFSGKVIWMGAKKYKGLWSARVGVKNASGEVLWVNANEVSV